MKTFTIPLTEVVSITVDIKIEAKNKKEAVAKIKALYNFGSDDFKKDKAVDDIVNELFKGKAHKRVDYKMGGHYSIKERGNKGQDN